MLLVLERVRNKVLRDDVTWNRISSKWINPQRCDSHRCTCAMDSTAWNPTDIGQVKPSCLSISSSICSFTYVPESLSPGLQGAVSHPTSSLASLSSLSTANACLLPSRADSESSVRAGMSAPLNGSVKGNLGSVKKLYMQVYQSKSRFNV